MIRRAVIPAAGLGTRLFPASKEQPKEMLPIFVKGADGRTYVKPLLQEIFEQLFEAGVREFCFITGKSKRAIEDHFTQDYSLIEMLRKHEKNDAADELKRFYTMIDGASIIWINQPGPRGFGDAVYRAFPFGKQESFLVHAGDTYIASPNHSYLKRLMENHTKGGAEATFIVDEVEDPRAYGVVEGDMVDEGVYEVRRVVEKPQHPTTNLAIVAVYIFNPIIFKALEKTEPDKAGEIQLTDAIQLLINWGFKVRCVKLKPEEVRVDIGNPETYWNALRTSFERPR